MPLDLNELIEYEFHPCNSCGAIWETLEYSKDIVRIHKKHCTISPNEVDKKG